MEQSAFTQLDHHHISCAKKGVYTYMCPLHQRVIQLPDIFQRKSVKKI